LSGLEQTDLIVLPEMFNTAFSMNAEELAEEFDLSESIEWLKQLAKVKNAAVYTSLMIQSNGNFYNRGVFVSQNIEKAFEISNLMATVANQKRILKEEYEQSLFYFENGGTFRADTTTITYVKTLKELIKESRLVVVDFNALPIEILDIDKFLQNLLDRHFQANNSYFAKFNELKKSRNIKNILDL
jgi:hypothetical protein